MQILYFASIREQLGLETEEIEWAPEITDIQTLIDFLCAKHDQNWRKVLSDPNLLVSINQELAALETQLSAKDEVAFFPPVTGG